MGIVRKYTNPSNWLNKVSIQIYFTWYKFPKRHSQQRKHKGRNSTQADCSPASHNDLLVRQLLAQVPDQVADAIEAMESHWQRRRELNQELSSDGERAKRSRNGRRTQLPAKERRRKIRHGEEVERTGTDKARDSVEHTRVPGDLWTVDRQVW